MFRSTHTYLDKTDRRCSDYLHQDFIDCISDEIKSSMKSINISCIPKSFADLLKYNSKELRFCNSSDVKSITEMKTLMAKRLMFYTGQPQEGFIGKCFWPCTSKSFTVQNARLSNAGASKSECYKLDRSELVFLINNHLKFDIFRSYSSYCTILFNYK